MPDDLIARLRGALPVRKPRNLTEHLLRPLSQGPLPVDMAAIRAERAEAAAALAAKDVEITDLRADLTETLRIRGIENAEHIARAARLRAAQKVVEESRLFAIPRREGLHTALAAYDALVKEPPSDAG